MPKFGEIWSKPLGSKKNLHFASNSTHLRASPPPIENVCLHGNCWILHSQHFNFRLVVTTLEGLKKERVRVYPNLDDKST